MFLIVIDYAIFHSQDGELDLRYGFTNLNSLIIARRRMIKDEGILRMVKDVILYISQ